jgi:hypothetical protein
MAEQSGSTGGGANFGKRGGGSSGSPPGTTGRNARTNTGAGMGAGTSANMAAITSGIFKDHLERRLAATGEAYSSAGSALYKGGEEA